MIGLHIISDIKEINFEKLQLTEEKIKLFISDSLKTVGLTELGSYYHTFGNLDEITGVIALAESHITFHVWPEKKYASLDIFVCNIKNDNSEKTKKLYNMFIKFFESNIFEEKFIERRNY